MLLKTNIYINKQTKSLW